MGANFGSRPDASLDFPFLSSSALEDVTSILRYINVSILFYSICFYVCDQQFHNWTANDSIIPNCYIGDFKAYIQLHVQIDIYLVHTINIRFNHHKDKSMLKALI